MMQNDFPDQAPGCENQITGEVQVQKDLARDFLSSVAHELRTPVAVIRGSLEALCDGVVCGNDQVEEYHHQMLSESIYLQRLVNDLLEYSRLQNREFEILKEKMNVCDLISDVCRSIRQIADSKQILISREEEVSLYCIEGDYERLRQMLIVVLDNAVKFSEPGGRVTVRNRLEDGRLVIEISDTGCGISEENIKDIFLRFHRSVSDKNRTGSGLGLAIAKEIASRHDTEIKVISEVGKGTTFSFIFGQCIAVPEE